LLCVWNKLSALCCCCRKKQDDEAKGKKGGKGKGDEAKSGAKG